MSKKQKMEVADEAPETARWSYVLFRKTHFVYGGTEKTELVGIYTSYQTLSEALVVVRMEHEDAYEELEECNGNEFDAHALTEPFERGQGRLGYYVLAVRSDRACRKKEVGFERLCIDPEANRKEFAFAGTMTGLERWVKSKMQTGLERWMSTSSVHA